MADDAPVDAFNKLGDAPQAEATYGNESHQVDERGDAVEPTFTPDPAAGDTGEVQPPESEVVNHHHDNHTEDEATQHSMEHQLGDIFEPESEAPRAAEIQEPDETPDAGESDQPEMTSQAVDEDVVAPPEIEAEEDAPPENSAHPLGEIFEQESETPQSPEVEQPVETPGYGEPGDATEGGREAEDAPQEPESPQPVNDSELAEGQATTECQVATEDTPVTPEETAELAAHVEPAEEAPATEDGGSQVHEASEETPHPEAETEDAGEGSHTREVGAVEGTQIEEATAETVDRVDGTAQQEETPMDVDADQTNDGGQEKMDVTDILKNIDELSGPVPTMTSSPMVVAEEEPMEAEESQTQADTQAAPPPTGENDTQEAVQKATQESFDEVDQGVDDVTTNDKQADDDITTEEKQAEGEAKETEYELVENKDFSEDSNSRPGSRVSDKESAAQETKDAEKTDAERAGDAEESKKDNEESPKEESGLTIASVVGGADASSLTNDKENGSANIDEAEKTQNEGTTETQAADVKPTLPIKPKTDAKPPKAPMECIVCKKVGKCKYNIVRNGDIKHLCDEKCFQTFRANPSNYLRSEKKNAAGSAGAAAPAPGGSPSKTCDQCRKSISQPDVGKHSYKVGRVSKHFCQNQCLVAYKTEDSIGTQCTYCKEIIQREKVTVGEVNDGVQAKLMAFCSQACFVNGKVFIEDNSDLAIVGQSQPKSALRCSVCHKVAPVKHEVTLHGQRHKICSDACFAAFRYANKLSMNACDNCGASCNPQGPAHLSLQFEGVPKRFCKPNCLNQFKQKKSRIVPCGWCGAKKPNFDMVERLDTSNKCQLFCSLNCLSLYRVNLQATSNKSINCDQCKKAAPAQYHLTMSDASVRNFCSYNCVMAFQNQFTPGAKAAGKQTPAGQLQRATKTTTTIPSSPSGSRQSARVASRGGAQPQPNLPMISNVVSLAPQQTTPQRGVKAAVPPPMRTAVATQARIIVQPPPPKELKNKALLCKPFQQTKATSCRPLMQTKETQTEEKFETKPIIVPIPVPYYVPVPMKMYNNPVPYPVPIPVPIPVPMFIPTTRKSADGILKQIKKIAESTPADPFEAELLMMAEVVAGAEKRDSESDSDGDLGAAHDDIGEAITAPVVEQSMDSSEDLLQMAIRAASMPSHSILDLEDTLASNPINPADVPAQAVFSTIDADADIIQAVTEPSPRRGRGGGRRRGRGAAPRAPKRPRIEAPQATRDPTPPPQQPPPDANMVLKYTYGVNAWKHWVVQKNEQLENAGRAKFKLMKTELLQCTADELNYSLCLFVKEVRKPNGDEYAADSIFYLTLGIQQYLYENGRIDNIFADFYYDRFTDMLNEILGKYEVRLNAQGLIVCRIEEEHLWECKQLGAHSPSVLMNTLVYFNTKYFMLRTAEDHLRLSFSHIMKHWKKTNVPGTKTPGRSVYLRYYAPVGGKADIGNKRKREDAPVYEQGENTENPLRCPVKLYEFYLSKCPESIKNRNDVFYLVPERSCVPDSPVWCSTQALGIEALSKMLNRLRVVREIQEAHLHHQPMGY